MTGTGLRNYSSVVKPSTHKPAIDNIYVQDNCVYHIKIQGIFALNTFCSDDVVPYLPSWALNIIALIIVLPWYLAAWAASVDICKLGC